MPYRPKILAVDLDGTILKYDDIDKPMGEPIPGIADVLAGVKSAGWCVIVWTVRNNLDEIRAHLNKHGVPFDYINENPWQPSGGSAKVAAHVYLDDRALRFEGDTQGLTEKILNFRPWYKEPSWMR